MAEGVVAGGDRRVRGEHAAGGDRFERRVERQTARQVLAQQLEDQERRVPFVQMPHGRLQAERAQRAHAADAEDHLLADARRFIAAVEAVRDVAIRRRVLRAVGVEQIHRHAADLRLPDARDHVAPGDAHADREPLAVGSRDRLDRQIARIVLAVLGVLHAVVVDASA